MTKSKCIDKLLNLVDKEYKLFKLKMVSGDCYLVKYFDINFTKYDCYLWLTDAKLTKNKGLEIPLSHTIIPYEWIEEVEGIE